MKTMYLWNFIFYLMQLYRLAYSYLSPTEYRTYTPILDDFSSTQFYSYFKLDLNFYSDNATNFVKTCQEQQGSVFGNFRNGNITTFFDYRGYGSMGINFNIAIEKARFTSNTNDTLNFYLSGNLVYSLELDTFSNVPLETTLCGKDVYLFNMSIIYPNEDLRYPPITFKASTSFNPQSSIDWAITNIQLIKISCIEKCSICDVNMCQNCDQPNAVLKANICTCDSLSDYYDYANLGEPLNCQLLEENYDQPYSNYDWFWNGYSISSFHYTNHCPNSGGYMFGGSNTFGNSDSLSKVIKLNDDTIFNFFKSAKTPFKYVNVVSYQIDITLAYLNWDSSANAVIQIMPTTKSNSIQILLNNQTIVNCDNNTIFTTASRRYSYAYDNPKYANITLTMPTTSSRKAYNLGLVDFVFSVFACHVSCLTCVDPSYSGCTACSNNTNSILQNGMCVCNPGYSRDAFNPNYPCVSNTVKNIISNGTVSISDLGYGSVLINHINLNSVYCGGNRTIVGGYVNKIATNHYIDIVTSDIGIIFYMKQITLELVTEDDNSLLYPFTILFNRNPIPVNSFTTNKLKYLRFTDAFAMQGNNTCYNTNKYKSYMITFYTYDKTLITDISIINEINSFWGILTVSVNYFECHPNCNSCLGYGIDQCISCPTGMILNMANYNLKNKTSSCLCDTANGYLKTSSTYDPLLCTHSSAYNFTYYNLNELNEMEFSPESWTSNYKQLSNEDVQVCDGVKILGMYDTKKQKLFEKNLNITQSIPNLEYSVLNFDFHLYFYNTLTNWAIKVFLDNQYVFGKYMTLGGYASYSPLDETVVCDTNNTLFYRKEIIFSYHPTDYYNGIISQNPNIRIEVYPDSECLFDSACGWGISNFSVSVNKTIPDQDTVCQYRPYSTEPCLNATNSRICYPGYYEAKTTNGEFKCIACSDYCYQCYSATICNTCIPGYSLINRVCVPTAKVLYSSQNNILKIDLNRYYSNLLYDFQGFSINIWTQLGEVLTTVDQPLLLIDPFLISYNSATNNYFLKFTNFNYLFSYSNLFPVIMNYTLQSNATVYQTQWIPISITFSYNIRSQDKSYYIQMSINNEPLQSAYFDNMYLPTSLMLFNYYSKVSYRYLKFWDRYIPINALNKLSYISDYASPPADLVLFYRMVEGWFTNKGSSDLVFVYEGDQFRWTYDTNPPITCKENQYYDFVKQDCFYCSALCSHCYDGDVNSCIDCTEPFPFYSNTNNICVTICPDSTVANYKYSTNLICQLSCPSECLLCDNLNGCLTCKPNYYLHNNTCIKYCTIDMVAANNPSCVFQSTTCTPSIYIENKHSFFLMDGTSLNLQLNVTDCGLSTILKWTSSLDPTIIVVQNGGKLLLVDSAYLTIPLRHYFDVIMYDQTGTNIISQDSVDIDFVSNSINGGHVLPFYLNSTITFSIAVFDQVIKPTLKGTVNYVWTCPVWVPFASCNPRINQPILNIDGGMVDASTFAGDLCYDISVSVLVDKLLYTRMEGFVVVYSERSQQDFFSFSVSNYTEISYNNPMKFQVNFTYAIERDVMINDLTINWSINRTDVQLMNGNNLPVFIFNPQLNSFGGYNVTCQVTYRIGTRVETSVTNNTSVYINPPIFGGVFTVTPFGGIFTKKFILTVTGITLDPNAMSDGSFVETFQYFYLNPSNQYSRIAYIDDMTSSYTPRLIPPTNSLKARVFYDVDSYYDLTLSVSIISDINFDYITNINNIFEYDASDGLLLLEAYALNFKSVQYSNEINLPLIIAQSNQKLIDILTVAKEYLILSQTINENIPRIGNILEAYTSQMTQLTDLSPYKTIFNQVFQYAQQFNNYAIFSSPGSANYMQAINNLISIYEKGSLVIPGIYDLFGEMNNILSFTLYNVDLSFERNYQFNNLEVTGTSVNTNYLQNDITYEFSSINGVNSNSGDYSRMGIYTSNSAQTSLRNLLPFASNISVEVNSTILNSQLLDGTIQIFYYSNIYNYQYTNLQNSATKVALVPDLIQVSFLNNTRYQIITIYNTTINNITKTNTNITSVQEYDSLKFNNESLVIINFTLPYSLNMDYINKTTCILINDNSATGDDEEAICNTWFDFQNQIIQCECDQMGLYTVVYNPYFKYLRKGIQFFQLSDTINQPWGYVTLTVLGAGFFIALIWAYMKDKRQFTQANNSSDSNQYFQEYQEKLNKANLNLRKITFGKLFCDIFKYANDVYSFKIYKDLYFLRAHRMLVFLLRIYILILFSFYVQFHKIDPTVQTEVDQRNIVIKPLKNTIYTFAGNFSQAIINSLYYAIPVGFVMIFLPRLAEWLFRYDEAELRFKEGNQVVGTIGTIFYGKLKAKCSVKIGNSFGRLKGNIEGYKESNKLDLSMEELKTMIDQRRFKAYINYHQMIGTILHDVRFNIFKSEKKENIPENLAPLYNQKVKAQIENYEERSYLTKKTLFKQIDNETDEGRMGIFKDKRRLMKNIDIFQEGKEFNQQELVSKYGMMDNLSIEVKSRVYEDEDTSLISIKKENKDVYDDKIPMLKKEKVVAKTKLVLAGDPVNAFIPHLVAINKKHLMSLTIKLVVIILIIGFLIFGITAIVIRLRNQAGEQKAILWIILTLFSLVENYLIYLPILCLVKTFLIMAYGPYQQKKFSCSFRNILFFFLVTDVDRAIFKELKEYVKANKIKDKARLNNREQNEMNPNTDGVNKDEGNNFDENELTDFDPSDEDQHGYIIKQVNEQEIKKDHEDIDEDNKDNEESKDQTIRAESKLKIKNSDKSHKSSKDPSIKRVSINSDKKSYQSQAKSKLNSLDKEGQKINYSSIGNAPPSKKEQSRYSKENNYSSIGNAPPSKKEQSRNSKEKNYSSIGNAQLTKKEQSGSITENNYSSIKNETSKVKNESHKRVGSTNNNDYLQYKEITFKNNTNVPSEIRNSRTISKDNDFSQSIQMKVLDKNDSFQRDYNSINQLDRSESGTNIIDRLKKMDSNPNLNFNKINFANSDQFEIKNQIVIHDEQGLDLSNIGLNQDKSRLDNDDSFI